MTPIREAPWRMRSTAVAERRRLRRLATSLAVLAALVALAVAATSVAGYVTLRYSLYGALDDELTDIASSLAVPVAQDIRNLGGLTDRALRAYQKKVGVTVSGVTAKSTWQRLRAGER